MRKSVIAALLFATAAAGPGAAVASDNARGGIPTETMTRLAADRSYNPIWDLVGLIGLLGVLGLWRTADNDGYTDDPI